MAPLQTVKSESALLIGASSSSSLNSGTSGLERKTYDANMQRSGSVIPTRSNEHSPEADRAMLASSFPLRKPSPDTSGRALPSAAGDDAVTKSSNRFSIFSMRKSASTADRDAGRGETGSFRSSNPYDSIQQRRKSRTPFSGSFEGRLELPFLRRASSLQRSETSRRTSRDSDGSVHGSGRIGPTFPPNPT